MCGVLLDVDGVALRRGRDEPGVGRVDHGFRAAREIDPLPACGVLYRGVRAHHCRRDCIISAMKHVLAVGRDREIFDQVHQRRRIEFGSAAVSRFSRSHRESRQPRQSGGDGQNLAL